MKPARISQLTMRKLLWGSFWTIVAIALLFHVAGGWYFSDELIRDGFTIDPDPIEMVEGGYVLEPTTYSTPLGEMDAWYLPAEGTTWVIHVHGKGATPAEAEPLFAPLQKAGYPQLAITYRNDAGQPVDPSGYYQYGISEWEDVSAAVDYALANGAERVVLSGFSSGAAHIMSFLRRAPRERVVALLMDAPNLDLSETVDYGASQRELPLVPLPVPPTLAATAKFFTSLRIGFNWELVDYLEEADRIIRQPVLVHHGTADLTVPIEESIRLAEAVPTLVRLLREEGAGHVVIDEEDPEKYSGEVLGFLSQFGG